MGIAIDRDLIENVDDPSLEIISYAIKQRQRSLKRLNNLFNIYNGKQDIQNRSLSNVINDDRDSPKIMINHAKYVTDMIVGFTTGNPISITSGKNQNIQPIMDVLERMDINSHDAEMEKDLSVFGEAYELVYLDLLDDGTTEERVSKIDPRGCVLVTDDSIDKVPLFGVHFQKKYTITGGLDGYLITVYTPHNVIKYRTGGLYPTSSSIRKKTVTQQYFGGVQLIELRNNEERQGDFEQAVSLMDAYNLLQSDRLEDKDAFVDSLLVTYGFEISDDIVKNGVLKAPGKGEDGASVEWLTKSFDESQVQVLAQALEDDIHKVTYVPNMNDKNFMGNVSGEAMKYKLFGLLQLLAVKERYLARGIRQRLTLLKNMVNVKGQQVDLTGTTIAIAPNIPVNMTDIIANIKNAQGIIPEQVALSWLPGTDNPDELLAMLKQEQQDNIDRQAEAISQMGNQATSDYDEEDMNDDKDSLSDKSAKANSSVQH